ncbi:MAG: hypothetical protein ACT4TC_09555 [Myxococcaceae bacterium]
MDIMSDPQAAPPASAAVSVPPAVDKREWATRVIYDVLALMELPARLDVKDAADGGLSVALLFDGEVPVPLAGKRSHVVDALQFLANKVVNRPNTERRWISIGVGAHPEPRPPPQERKPAPVQTSAPVQSAAPVAGVAPPRSSASPPKQQHRGPSRSSEQDEKTLEVSEDAVLAKAAQSLAQKSAQLGRYLAIVGMKNEDRARVLKAVGGTAGVTVKSEGEGRNRRVVFTPDKPAPMPKRTHPNFDDDEDEAEE